MTASTPSRRRAQVALAVTAAALGAGASLAVACSGSSDSGVVVSSDDGGRDTGSRPRYDGGGAADTSTGADTGPAHDAGSPGADAASDAAGFDAGPPLCNPAATVGSKALLTVSTPDPDLLGAVSNNELVVAWTSLPADAGGAGVVHWAERPSLTAAFGPTHTLDASFGPFAPDHVAMSGDGLRLLVVSADHARVTEIVRAAPGDTNAFAAVGGDFPGVNPRDGGDGVSPGIGPFGSPALGPDLAIWAYTQGANGLTLAQNLSGWNVVTPLPTGLVPASSGPTAMIATGWSADDRTFFYWDTSASTARAVWRDPATRAFSGTRDLGPEQFAYPGGACSRLYFSAPGAGGDLDLFVAPLQ